MITHVMFFAHSKGQMLQPTNHIESFETAFPCRLSVSYFTTRVIGVEVIDRVGVGLMNCCRLHRVSARA